MLLVFIYGTYKHSVKSVTYLLISVMTRHIEFYIRVYLLLILKCVHSTPFWTSDHFYTCVKCRSLSRKEDKVNQITILTEKGVW